MLAAQEGQAEPAFELVGAADALRKAIGSPRGEAREAELERLLAEVRNGSAEAARARGAELEADAVFAAALAACSPSRGASATM